VVLLDSKRKYWMGRVIWNMFPKAVLDSQFFKLRPKRYALWQEEEVQSISAYLRGDWTTQKSVGKKVQFFCGRPEASGFKARRKRLKRRVAWGWAQEAFYRFLRLLCYIRDMFEQEGPETFRLGRA
jgi:hypothetical protein